MNDNHKIRQLDAINIILEHIKRTMTPVVVPVIETPIEPVIETPIEPVIVEPVPEPKPKKKVCRKKYNDRFYEKNRAMINTSVDCQICGGTYTYYGKSNHNKTIRHQKCLSISKKKLTPLEQIMEILNNGNTECLSTV